MAEETSKRPVWVTLVAAAATVVVVLGVAAGPTVAGCLGSDPGFSACMRTTLANIGLISQGSAPITAPEKSSTSIDVASTPEVEPVIEAPEELIAPVEVAAPIVPRLGLVRAEPDGSLVIAGSAEPGIEVEIYASGKLLGRVMTESNGDWVLVPDVPLPPGGVEITVATPSTGQVAERSVVIIIQDDRTTEPLVVASSPGEASDILQGIAAQPQVVEEPTLEVAAVEPAPSVQPTSQPTTPEPVVVEPPAAESQPAQQVASTQPEPVIEEPVVEVTPTQPVVAEPVVEVTQPEPVIEEPAAAEVMPIEPVVEEPVMEVAAAETVVEKTASETLPAAPAPTPEPVAVEQTPVTEPQEVPLQEAPEQPDMEVAAIEPETIAIALEQVPVQLPLTPPSIDAIEVDGSKNFFAGAGAEGATVRLYVDDAYIDDTRVAEGRWLIETDQNVLSKLRQRVRIDMLRPGTAEVVARAEVNFEIDLPEPAPVVVAEPEPAPEREMAPEPTPAVVAEVEPTPTVVAEAEPTPTVVAEAEPTPAVVAEAEPTPVVVAEAEAAPVVVAEVESAPVPVIEPAPAVAAEPAKIEQPESTVAEAVVATETAIEPPVEAKPEEIVVAEAEPVAEPTPTLVEEVAPVVVAEPEPTPEPVVETAETPAQEEVVSEVAIAQPDVMETKAEIPTLRAVAVGDPEDLRFASGKAIIRRGDNLWTIAHRVYGSGYRYTIIYQANNSQIRNPNLIYPGQVFELPDDVESK